MFPILYESITAGSVPQHNGLGTLSPISCVVEQERNGIYELTMEYSSSGIHASDLALRRIIKAKPNFTDAPQLFRIDRIGKEMNGKFMVYAKHISYDLAGYPITSGSANNAASACLLLENAANGWHITTDKTVSANFAITTPASVKSYFVGREGSFLDVFGTAEIKYDNFNVQFLLHAGQNRNVTIRYGKNLLALSQEMDCSNLYTHVLCFYKNEDGVINGNDVSTGLNLDVPHKLVLDVSSEFDETPSVADLTAKAQAYINSHNLTVPANNITLDFVQIGQLKDRVDLCDTVSVYYEALGITAEVKCIRTKWDVIREKYIETEFGDVKQNIADTITENNAEIEKTKTDINAAYQNAKDYTDAVKASLDDDIENLQAQIDGNITTWYYDYEPTTENEPASEWTTEEEKENHAGDLFFDNTTQFCYRWTYIDGAWAWVMIQDSTISQAIGMAQQALDEAEAAISGVSVEYAQNQSTTVAPTSGWSTTAPAWQEGYYIWSRTKTTTSTGSTYSTPVCISGRDGQDGAKGDKGDTGTGVSTITPLYFSKADTTAPSKPSATVTTNNPTVQNAWNKAMPNYSASYPYVFTCSETKYSDNTYAWSDVTRITLQDYEIGGRNLLADTKKDKDQTHSTYNICDFNFTESIVEGEVYTLSASVTTSAEKKGIAFYHSGGSIIMGTWYPISADGLYVATFTGTAAMAAQTQGLGHGFCRVYVSNNNATAQGSTPITGTANVNWIKIEKGAKATDWTPAPEDQNGIKSITGQYYLSTSNQTQTGGSWANTQPAWESGKYIWTRSYIVYNDGTTGTTTPVLATAINNANDLADHKRRVFITTPVPPYDEGDLWVLDGAVYYCIEAKTASQAYSEDDWSLATDYVNASVLENAIAHATELITGNAGGYVVIRDTNADGQPDEILIMNTPSIETATQIWRWNKNGLGYSTSYASSEYALALTADGQINASRILTGELDASRVTIQNLTANMFAGGKIQLGGYNNYDGVFELYNASGTLIGQMDKNGVKFYGSGTGNNRPYVLFNNDVGFAGFAANGTKQFWVDRDEFHMKKCVAENEIQACGKIKFLPITTYDTNNNIINDGVAVVGI